MSNHEEGTPVFEDLDKEVFIEALDNVRLIAVPQKAEYLRRVVEGLARNPDAPGHSLALIRR